MIILLLELVRVYVVGYYIDLQYMNINIKNAASDFVLQSVSVVGGKNIGDEEEAG